MTRKVETEVAGSFIPFHSTGFYVASLAVAGEGISESDEQRRGRTLEMVFSLLWKGRRPLSSLSFGINTNPKQHSRMFERF